MEVDYYVFKDVQLAASGATTDEEILERGGPEAAKLRRLRYSFVSMCPEPVGGKLFLGCTHWGGDILVAFDLRTHKFRSCGFSKSGLLEPDDAKIHNCD